VVLHRNGVNAVDARVLGAKSPAWQTENWGEANIVAGIL